VQQATSEKQRLEQARAEQRQGAGNLFDELLSRGGTAVQADRSPYLLPVLTDLHKYGSTSLLVRTVIAPPLPLPSTSFTGFHGVPSFANRFSSFAFLLCRLP